MVHKKEESVIPNKLIEPVPDYLKELFINHLKLHKATISARIITMVQNELQIITNITNNEKIKKELLKSIDELISENDEQLTYINIYTLKIENTSEPIKNDFQYLNFYLENVKTGIDTLIYDKYYTKYLLGKKPYDNNYRAKENEATKKRKQILERIYLVSNIKKQNEIEKQLCDIKEQKKNLDNQISNCTVAKTSINDGTGFVQEDKNSLKIARRQLERNENFLENEKMKLDKLTDALKKEKEFLKKDEDSYYMLFLLSVVISGLFIYLTINYKNKYNKYYNNYEDLRKKYNNLVKME